MKRLFAVIIVATLAYCGWWFYAAQDLRSDVEDWFAAQRAEGWTASYTDLSMRGFPSRTDLTISNPDITGPEEGFAWRAPFLQILALSYKPGHVIVVWPDTQTLTMPDGEMAVSSDGLRASVVFEDQKILRSNAEAPVLNIAGPEVSVAVADAIFALEKFATTDATYRVAVSAGRIATSLPNAASSIGPDALASLRADMDIEFDQPLRLDTHSESPPRPTRVNLKRSALTYGEVTFRVSLAASIDRQGVLTGDMSISAENWRKGIDAARENGDLPAEISDGLIDLLAMLSTFNGTRDSLDVTLGINGGTLLLGPVPVGRIPPLRWP